MAVVVANDDLVTVVDDAVFAFAVRFFVHGQLCMPLWLVSTALPAVAGDMGMSPGVRKNAMWLSRYNFERID